MNYQKIEEKISILKIDSLQNQKLNFPDEIEKNVVQIYFINKGDIVFSYHNNSYQVALTEGESMILYNPNTNLPLNLIFDQGKEVKLFGIFISVETLHELLFDDLDSAYILSAKEEQRNYYSKENFSPKTGLILEEIFNNEFNLTREKIFLKAKTLELLCIYFEATKDYDVEKCPFLKDEANVQKIRKAKKILISNLQDNISIKDLSEELSMSEYQLNLGFKNIYGESPNTYIRNYKMSYALQLLQKNNYIKEIAYEIGYSTPSHFINAFKKKYGYTPKQYLKNHSK